MTTPAYPPDTGPLAGLSETDKKKRLDAMVALWQRTTERRIERDGYRALVSAMGLDVYRYAVWLRFPEWQRAAAAGQVVTLGRSASGSPEDPLLFTAWRQEPMLRAMPDWKQRLPSETVFNITVRITPGGLGEGSKWAIVMPKEMIPRYKPAWTTQRDWVAWTLSFDWLSVAIGFIHMMLDAEQ